jgi:hypothetical protein
MTALQWIIKEAKIIRKKSPKMEWKKAVAQASAIYASKHKGKSPVGKKKAAPKKKTAKKRKVAGIKASKEVKKVLAKKGLKMPHGYSTIKRVRKVSGVKKKKISEQSILNRIHKVKDSVSKLDEAQHKHMMGMNHHPVRFTRINNDINGNPRYAIHFLDLINSEENQFLPFSKKYEYALKKAKKIGGKKYDNKQYGGGIVFQSYNIEDLEKKIIALRHTTPKIKI